MHSRGPVALEYDYWACVVKKCESLNQRERVSAMTTGNSYEFISQQRKVPQLTLDVRRPQSTLYRHRPPPTPRGHSLPEPPGHLWSKTILKEPTQRRVTAMAPGLKKSEEALQWHNEFVPSLWGLWGKPFCRIPFVTLCMIKIKWGEYIHLLPKPQVWKITSVSKFFP